MKYICMVGYDDITYISEKDWGYPFTPDEIITIKKIEKLSKKISTCGAEPILWMDEYDEN